MDPALALAQFATLTGGAALIVALVEVIKRTFAWTDATSQRFSPLSSLVLGVVMLVFLAASQGSVLNWAEPIFAGIVTGLYACGLYSVGGGAVIQTVAPRAAHA